MIRKVAKEIASNYLNNNVDPTKAFIKAASEGNWDTHQIKYAAGQVNRLIISSIQSQVPGGQYDPHFSFDTVKEAEVIAVLNKKEPAPLVRPTLPSRRPLAGRVLPSVTPPPVRQDCDYEAVGKLFMAREKIRKKKAQLTSLEMQLNDHLSRFKKEAAHRLLSGVPVEVIQSLGVKEASDEVIDTISSWGHKLSHIEDEFDIDPSDSLVKLSHSIKDLQDEIQSAADDYATAMDELS